MKTDPRYATNVARMRNNAELQQIVIDWIKSHKRDDVLEILGRHEVVAAAVNDAKDITGDPHFLERTLNTLTDTVFGPGALVPGPVLHVEDYDGPRYEGVPAVGEHTTEVLAGEVGIAAEELVELRAAGVIAADG
jgi:crotonobetainyl-CoA:carnitine CoA-transferase CaiB-like acyl-CoA transferase